MLRFYIEVAKTAFRRQLIYRWANLAGLLTNIFFGCIMSYVTIALFQARHSAGGYTVVDTLRYLWLIQSMIMFVLPFIWTDLMLTIRSGDVISDLNKPYDFCWYWFSRELGRDVYYLIFRGIPTYCAGMFIFGLGVPGTLQGWLLYCISVAMGATVGIAYRYLYNIAAFWLLEGRAMGVMATVIALFFTGSYVPLAFFPVWSQAIVHWLPFNALMNLPAEIVLGKVTGVALWFELFRQLFWVCILTFLVRAVTSRASQRVTVQGG